MADGVDVASKPMSRQSLMHLYRFHRIVIPRHSPDDTDQQSIGGGEKDCTTFETILDRSKTYGKACFLSLG